MMLAGLNDVIGRFASGTYSVIRTREGDYVKGRYSEGAQTTFSMVASIQPLSGRDLMMLSEGQQTSETRLVLSTTELRTRTPDHEPDIVVIDGEEWEVFRSEKWEAFGEVHYRAFIMRLAGD